jgi:anti-anti-sigma factor
MELSVRMIERGVKKISLAGRMDIPGTEQIDLRLAAETATEKAFVILDLSGVEFLASVGIGALVRSAKALRMRGGRSGDTFHGPHSDSGAGENPHTSSNQDVRRPRKCSRVSCLKHERLKSGLLDPREQLFISPAG